VWVELLDAPDRVAEACGAAAEAGKEVIITVEKLIKARACPSQMRAFERLYPVSDYPAGVRVTIARCVEHANVFDWYVAVAMFVPGSAYANCRVFNDLTREARLEWLSHISFSEKRAEAHKNLLRTEARTFALMIRNPKLRAEASA
jgi:hypothetical protein